MRFFVISIFLFSFYACVNGQNNAGDGIVQDNVVNDDRIKTVQLFRENWNLSYPIIKQDGNEKLLLEFDLLGNDPETFYYSFIFCDKDWNEAGAFINDYLDGYGENPIEDYKASFNTTVQYYHYSLAFPNDRVSLKLSGNYIIAVYLPGNTENPVIKRRFMVTEDAVKIDINAHRPQMTAESNTQQQIDFNVSLNTLQINDPYRNVYASILQNGRWDNSKNNIKPEFFGNNELKYSSLSEKNIFPGGNEYRYFDTKSIRYQSENVRGIEFKAPYYNVYLSPSENREFKPYFYRRDFNGKYYVAFQEGRNPETDADYVNVYFTLPAFQPVEGGDMFVFGALTDWKAAKNAQMIYNPQLKQYECTMLLKQGWYDYEYAFMKKGDLTPSAVPFEGSHYETENDYLILIYYRNPRERYDRLIGTAIQNTLNRIVD